MTNVQNGLPHSILNTRTVAFIGNPVGGMPEALDTWVSQAVRGDRALIVLDAGHGDRLLGQVSASCVLSQREQDLIRVDPSDPDSARIDPLHALAPFDIARVLSRAAATTGHSFTATARCDLPMVADLIYGQWQDPHSFQHRDNIHALGINAVVQASKGKTEGARRVDAYLKTLHSFRNPDSAVQPDETVFRHQERMTPFLDVLSSLSSASGGGGRLDLDRAITTGKIVYVKLDPTRLDSTIVRLAMDTALDGLLQAMPSGPNDLTNHLVSLAILGVESGPTTALLGLLASARNLGIQIACGVGNLPALSAMGPEAAEIARSFDTYAFLGPVADMASQQAFRSMTGRCRFVPVNLSGNRPGDAIVVEGSRMRRHRGVVNPNAAIAPVLPQDLLVDLAPPSQEELTVLAELPRTLRFLADGAIMSIWPKLGDALQASSDKGPIARYAAALRTMPRMENDVRRACGAFAGGMQPHDNHDPFGDRSFVGDMQSHEHDTLGDMS